MEITRHRSLPGGRAVLGGVLMAVAVVGVFLAYEQATRSPSEAIVVATKTIRVGEILEPDDLRTVEGKLPGDAIGFRELDPLVGRIALGPIGEGEIVQAAAVTDQAAADEVHEVEVTLPRQQVAVGRLKTGERIDLFVTYDESTTSVVRGARVVQIDAGDGAGLTSDREVSLVIAVPSGDAVAAVVHALRTGDVTVVRSTFGETSTEPLRFEGGGDTSATTEEQEDS